MHVFFLYYFTNCNELEMFTNCNALKMFSISKFNCWNNCYIFFEYFHLYKKLKPLPFKNKKFDFLTFIRWWRYWTEQNFHGAWNASCRILAPTTSFITRWTSKYQILTLIFTLYFWIIFCVFIVMVQWKLCATKKLITNEFSRDTKQPSNVMPTNQDIPLSVTSPNDNVTWSIGIHRCMKPYRYI